MKLLSKKVNSAKANHWQSIIDEWEQSSLTQKDFCKQQKIKYTNFSKWKQRLNENEAVAKQQSFIPVEQVDNSSASPTPPVIRLLINDKCTLELPLNLDVKILVQLFEGIGLTSCGK